MKEIECFVTGDDIRTLSQNWLTRGFFSTHSATKHSRSDFKNEQRVEL